MTSSTTDRHILRSPSFRHETAFAKLVEDPSSKLQGEDGYGNPAEFIPVMVLCRYWIWTRIRDALTNHEAHAQVETIQKPYIRVFSILALVNGLDYLDEFLEYGVSDERLPLKQPPAQWPTEGRLRAVLDSFLESQWKFCPLIIRESTFIGQRLDHRHILPIRSKEVLCEASAESEIFKVTFHQECMGDEDGKDGKDGKLPNTVVLKAYTHRTTASDLWKAEANAFTRLHNSAPNPTYPRPINVISCYGHFIQCHKHYLVLEYAEGGCLEQYFRNTPPPESAEDLLTFWKSMFGLINGLVLVHNLGRDKGGIFPLSQGSHQDIKPANILVARKSSSNRYNMTLKLCDFGMSDFWQVSGDTDIPRGVDKRGDQMYSAPECIRNSDVLHRIDNFVDWKVDIWSLGCVFSEATVWAVCGQQGLHDYLDRRTQETIALSRMNGTGFEGCFHNGLEPLDAVTLMHDHILKSKRSWDTITDKVVQLLRESMLLEHMCPRRSAKDLLQISEKYLQEARDATVGVLDISSSSSLVRTGAAPGNKIITVEEIQRYRVDIKSSRPPNKNVDAECRTLQNQIEGRDHIFLMDDSSSMKRQHREAVFNTFIALSFLAKRIDRDKIDLIFTSQPGKRHSGRRTAHLFKKVQESYNNQFRVRSTMEASMSEIIDHIISRLTSFRSTVTDILGTCTRPHITLFVFTDGLWGNTTSPSCGVQGQIERLIDVMKAQRLSRTRVAIQFIRFGDSAEGIHRLRCLDDFGKGTDWDIVDTKSHKDHVPDMFMGSIDSNVDNNDEGRWETAI